MDNSDNAPNGPGIFPFTAGIHSRMYAERLWTMRLYAGFGSPAETNTCYRRLLAEGQTGLSVAFDLPTQKGLDPTHPLAKGEVGKVGVSIASLADMEDLFKDIPLDQVTTSMTINSPASIILAFYLVAAERRNIRWTKLGGTTQNDPLKEFAARNTFIFPPKPSMRLATDLIGFCTLEVPRWHPISVSGYHLREAGATAAQELGYTLAHGIAYVNAAVEAGIPLEAFAERLSFFFNVQRNVFEEIAKFRAARRMWARIMRDRFGAKSAKAQMLRCHAQTAGSALHAPQMDVNVIRGTLQALTAVLGGVQSLHTSSRDEAVGLPTEESQRLSLRTQQVIAFESGVPAAIDPFEGSRFMEELTDCIEAAAQLELDAVQAEGGALAANEKGFIEGKIAEAAYIQAQAVERGDEIVVGVNRFRIDEPSPPRALVLDPKMEEERRRRHAEFRNTRTKTHLASTLELLTLRAKDGALPLMPGILQAVRANATLGEITAALKETFGEHVPIPAL